jgi:prepilin-type N-terminal cleavage/methylation domain-containing protein
MKRNKKKGFTLVEIMIVVLIIGILLAIAVPNFIKAREKSRAKTIAATLTKVDGAKEQCAMDEGLGDGGNCPDITEYLQNDPTGANAFPVQGTFTEGTIGSGATFVPDSPVTGVTTGTADEWKDV